MAYISSAYAMRRSDKQADRVEIHPEQLSAAAMEAECLALKLQRPIQVTSFTPYQRGEEGTAPFYRVHTAQDSSISCSNVTVCVQA